MGQKDLSEKILADYNDVFADIVNVLVLEGRQRIDPDDLTATAVTKEKARSGHYFGAAFWNEGKMEQTMFHQRTVGYPGGSGQICQ